MFGLAYLPCESHPDTEPSTAYVSIQYTDRYAYVPVEETTDVMSPSITRTPVAGAWNDLDGMHTDIDREIGNGIPPMSTWMLAINIVNSYEDELLLGVEPTSAVKSQHKIWLEKLVEQGELMKQLSGCADPALIQTYLDYLKLKNLGWHGTMTNTEATDILNEVFGGNS